MEELDHTNHNHGVILGQRPEDWQAGGVSQITFEERNPSGDWRRYLPIGEKQFGKEDFMDCVTFSQLSAIEIQEIFLTGNEVNYSDRWIAKLSGTTHEGNYLYKVADAIRQYGLVLESDYPTEPNLTFNEYYKTIPGLDSLTVKGQAWLKTRDFKYEFITPTKTEMMKHIKQAPLQIVIPGHAIVNFLCEQDIADYFDSYSPFQKTTPYSNVQSCLKPLLTLKDMNTYVKTINLDGEIAGYVPLREQKDIDLFSLIFNKQITVMPDGSIPTDLTAKKV